MNGVFTATEQYVGDKSMSTEGMPFLGVGGVYYFTVEALADGPAEGLFSIKNSRVWSGDTIGEITIPIYVQ